MREYIMLEGDGSLLTGEFAKFVQETLEEWKIPNVSIAVIDGEDVFTQYGASTTNGFVCAALAHLIDTRAYPALDTGWATSASSMIRDDFVLKDAWAMEHLTLEDAACHHWIPAAEQRQRRYAAVKDLIRNQRNLDMTEGPRVKFSYCNLMYSGLSHVIETLTGKPLGDVLRELIWEPPRHVVYDFTLDAALSAPEHLITGYYWDHKEEKYSEVPYIGYCTGQRPLSAAVHQYIRAPRIFGGMPEQGRDIFMCGLGWQRTLCRGHLMYTHSGGIEAFGKQVYWFPEAKFGVVAFGNTSTTSNAAEDALVYRLAHEKLGVAPNDLVDVGVEQVVLHD
ncbi:hypothetical protein G7Z17_g11408 [Cylindrodendrum hubeiense]|uniref:Beta-lactamase-related domain-containing protein n=1 Tax=Cylindrodendrum hubeiense TaxID=595255 RepID=A0A9P5H124_9HYPO|nr:hypothetical protein G7Z17_g11408 [Cylindrodendrum hubeiense]